MYRLVLFLFAIPGIAFAHPGALNSFGAHLDRETGVYHHHYSDHLDSQPFQQLEMEHKAIYNNNQTHQPQNYYSPGTYSNSTNSTYGAMLLEASKNKSSAPETKSKSQKHHDQFMSAFDRQRPRSIPKAEHEDNPKITIIRNQHKPGELAPLGTIKRDKHGRIERSEQAKIDFKKQHPCPSTGKTSGSCPGYVIDHVQALYKGGTDSPLNMQWQTIAEGKAKDKWE